MIYYSVSALAAIVIVGGLIFAMGSAKENEKDKSQGFPAYSASVLTVLESDYNFGTINMKNGNVSHRFALKNEGSEVIRIEKVSTSCMCTTAYIYDESGAKRGPFGMPGHGLSPSTNIEVGAGGTVGLEAVFDPAAHGPQGTGKVKRVVYIDTNSQTKPKLQLTFEADVAN